jgi:hypothetical protein
MIQEDQRPVVIWAVRDTHTSIIGDRQYSIPAPRSGTPVKWLTNDTHPELNFVDEKKRIFGHKYHDIA